ncbi:uncharacterized protein LOC110715910 [Chenopodium quinoa]|uniref:uncharacterized protein LOC110715910 n=1 Tax=Chenopodium quinoa TaxID=63459 RepID=UPI000B7839A3|nr:uncharacterized protein LOC110715910 [Chenopodium quinoa]
MINLQKSFVRFSANTPQDYKDFLSSTLHMQARSSIGEYLGLPVDLSRRKCKDFQFMVDRIAQRLSSFASLHLSSAAKLVIINSVLVAAFNHVLSVFKIPTTICDRIDSLLSRFWWRSGQSSKGLALAPDSMFYLVFDPSSQLLVSRAVKAKYPTLLSPRPYLSTVRSSWGSKGLLEGGSVIQKGLSWKIGSGKLFPQSIASAILALECPKQEIDDFIYWKHTRDGSFSTKSAYSCLLSSLRMNHNSLLTKGWWKRLWGLPILPKCKVFTWKICNNALPTAAVLSLKVFSSQLWSRLALACCSNTSTDSPFLGWFENIVSLLAHDKDWNQLDAFFSLCWAIWIVRNNARFRSEVYSPQLVLDLASSWHARSRDARVWDPGTFSAPPGFPFRSTIFFVLGPMHQDYEEILYVDGSWDSTSFTAGAGWCFRRMDSSTLVAGGARACTATFAFHSELLACCWGLRHAIQRGISKLLICTDCILVPRLIVELGFKDVSVMWIRDDICSLIPSLSLCHIQKVPRSSVVEAHRLAGAARRRQIISFVF